MKKGIILVCVMLLVSACSFFKKDKLSPPPEPTRIALKFETAGDINPDYNGLASPLLLRIYQLKSYSEFKDADYFSLDEKDEQFLGKDLMKKEEILLRPNEKRTVFYEEVSDDIRTIGIFGAFRDYEQAQWKAAASVQKNRTNIIKIYVSGTKLTIK